MTPTLSVDQLREWLEQGRPLAVLDVRSAEQRAEWRIPGSLHLGPDGRVLSGGPDGATPAELPRDRPVVAVCGRGRSSVGATDRLLAQGFDAYSLVGGMKAWSLAWNLAEVPARAGAARVLQLRRTGKGCLSYLVIGHGEAMAIDPSLDPEIYVRALEPTGAKLVGVLETHVHADHLSRARALAERTGAALIYPETDRLAFERHAVGDGDTAEFGGCRIEVLRTSGHTFESTCYRLDGWALFSGDTLFLDAVGRPDLKSADAAEVRERAALLWRSLQRLLALPGDTVVLPGHVSQPIAFDGRPLAASLDEVRARVPLATQPEDAFVRHVVGRLPETPPNHLEIVRLNERGELPDGDLTDLEAGANRCAIG